MTLICLISGQLAPNLFSIIMLKPQYLVLVHTKNTQHRAVQLKKVLEKPPFHIPRISLILTDPFDFHKIRTTAAELANQIENEQELEKTEIVLNNTAGTKPMALEFSNMFMSKGWSQVYFDAQNEMCWWKYKDTIEAKPYDLSINVIDFLTLNGANVVGYTSKHLIHQLLPLANFIWNQKKENPKSKVVHWLGNFSKAGLKPDEIPVLNDPILNVSKIYKEGFSGEKELHVEVTYNGKLLPQTNPRFWVQWFVGGWFEYKIFELLNTNGQYDDVQCNIKFGPTTSEESTYMNEIDVVAIKNGIPVFIECKTGKVEQKHITNLQSLSHLYGGKYSQLVLATLLPVSSKGLKEKMSEFNIEYMQGFNGIIKGLRNFDELIVIRT